MYECYLAVKPQTTRTENYLQFVKQKVFFISKLDAAVLASFLLCQELSYAIG